MRTRTVQNVLAMRLMTSKLLWNFIPCLPPVCFKQCHFLKNSIIELREMSIPTENLD